jgi:hypothetical protein
VAKFALDAERLKRRQTHLVYNAWAIGLSTPIHSFGPKGLEALTRTYFDVNKFEIETRIEDEGRPELRKLLSHFRASAQTTIG